MTADDGSCDTGDGESDSADDCNDADNVIFPGATDTPDDGIDQDCNGTDSKTCFVDSDQDGFGTFFGTTVVAPDGSCDTAEQEADTPEDCNDDNADIFPGAPETPDDGTDQDCSGSDTITCTVDQDMDGLGNDLGNVTLADDGICDAEQGESNSQDDCDDDDANVFPGAPEVPGDGIDQDCDGVDSVECFSDTDGDGFGTGVTLPPGGPGEDCTGPGESRFDTDCNDQADNIFPGAMEIPDDGIDQDCNDFDTIECFTDADGDGFGNDAGDVALADDGSCDQGQGESVTSDDCDDTNAEAFPGRPEIIDDGIDQDCNGFDSVTCFVDDDQDGFGTDQVDTVVSNDGSCDTAEKESPAGNDCDDADSTIFPDAIYH